MAREETWETKRREEEMDRRRAHGVEGFAQGESHPSAEASDAWRDRRRDEEEIW